MIFNGKPLVDKELIRKWKRYLLVTIIFFVIFILLAMSYLRIIQREDLITIAVIIFSFIFALAEVGLVLNYLRWPLSVKIDERGITYRTVTGKTSHILWEKVLSVELFDDKTVYITYITRLGKVSLPIQKDVGEEIRRAWERWKEEQEVKR